MCFRRLTFGAQILRGTSGTADGETVKSSARPSSIQTSSGAGLQQPPSARVICLLRGGQRCALSDIGPKIRDPVEVLHPLAARHGSTPWLHPHDCTPGEHALASACYPGVQPGGVELLDRILDVHTWQGNTLAIFLDCASRHMYFLLGSHSQTLLAPCKSRLFPSRHDWAEPVSLEGRPASNVLRKQHVARVLSPSRARTPSPVRVLALPLLQALPFSHVCVCV